MLLTGITYKCVIEPADMKLLTNFNLFHPENECLTLFNGIYNSIKSMLFYFVSDNVDWFKQGQDELSASLKMAPNMNVAKNIILFLGDGMGISTVTAARILSGQKRGRPGEESQLTSDQFPHAALIKVGALFA